MTNLVQHPYLVRKATQETAVLARIINHTFKDIVRTRRYTSFALYLHLVVVFTEAHVVVGVPESPRIHEVPAVVMSREKWNHHCVPVVANRSSFPGELKM